MSSLETPPALTDEDCYTEWLQDVSMWAHVTKLPKTKHGPAVFLSLSSKIRECVRSLAEADLVKDTGLKTLTDELDRFFKLDENTRAFMCFKEFYSYKRQSGTTINDFMVKYEYLYQKLVKFKIELPEGVQAFFLLQAANVSEENEKLARTTCLDMTYKHMKEAIRKMFGDSTTTEGAAPAVKSEPESVNASFRGNFRGNFRGRGGFRGRGNSSRGSFNRNPTDRSGKPLTCFKCNSPSHFAKDCPIKTFQPQRNGESNIVYDSKTDSNASAINITLLNVEESAQECTAMSKSEIEKMSGLVKETLGRAVLDSACTSTICGELWLKVYLEMLSEEEMKLVQFSKSEKSYCFGDGKAVQAIKKVKVPARIGSEKVYIETDVVSNELPLLLSRKSMKAAGMVLDFNSDHVWFQGRWLQLKTTTSGHYSLRLSQTILDDDVLPSIVLHVKTLHQCSTAEKKKKAIKLHRQFAHASKEKLVGLVRSSKAFSDKEFLQLIHEVCDECQVCLKFRKPPIRPVVGMPLGRRFNDTVCLDLAEYEHHKSWVLHLIDSTTRYSQAKLITSKKKEVIIENIYLMWISYFGSPVRFLSDNGGEFSNDHYRQMNEKLNIETCTTAAYSPFSNGTCERHNAVIMEAMKKTVEEEKCEPEVALAWAISAKNALHNNSGYSPNEIVFGFNVNTPSVLTDQLPALDTHTTSDTVRIMQNARHTALKNHIEADASDKIRKALRSKVRSYSDEHFEPGDKVYYKRPSDKGKRGPATVLGVDGQLVLVRHGGQFNRIHPCQLIKINRKPIISEDKLEETSKERKKVKVIEKKKSTSNQSKVSDSENDDEENGADEENGTEDLIGVDGDVNEDNVQYKDGSEKPKRKKYVEFKIRGTDNWRKAKVRQTQPRANGRYKNWVNVDEDEEPVCIKWTDVDQWRELSGESDKSEESDEEESDGAEQVVLLTGIQQQAKEVIMAKEKEIDNMRKHDVFECVPNTGQPSVSSRFVITEKIKDGERVVKARLVARGFEENNTNLQTDSPTCSREALRLVMLTAVIMGWRIQTIDFTSAFLQGEKMNRELFLRLPSDVCPSSELWKLKKCIYGLNDAPRAWFLKISRALLKLKGKVSAYDNALYMWHDEKGKLYGILAMHVDDFELSGNSRFQKEVVEELKTEFNVGAHESGTSFKYLGLHVTQTKGKIKVDQEQYISTIAPINISKERSRRKNDELNKDEKKELKRLSGQMMWVSSQTRPDISFDVCKISNVGKHPKVQILADANKSLIKLKSKQSGISFKKIGRPEELTVSCYCDATYASLEDGSSQGGFIVLVEGEKGIAPISWQSKKLDRVTKSPIASECLSVSEVADAGFLIAVLLQEVFQLHQLPNVNVKTDNSSLVETLHSSNLVGDKRLRVDIARIKEMMQRKEISVSWIRGTDQISDCLTKSGASSQSLLDVLN